ncbi:MAG: Y-family DNA polymerase, partial [Melioribacteraceae bacterium]
MPLRNLFLDFNSYFASVEQQLNPALRNKPVAVVPTKAETTCCIAASYEAKKFGIKTGTIVSEAKKLCPGLIIVEANHRSYIEFHHKLVETVGTCLPVDQVMSVDEMVCSLIGKE